MTELRIVAGSLALLLCAACNPSGNSDDGGDDDGTAGPGDWEGGDLVGGDTYRGCDFDDLATTVEPWTPGNQAFVDRTEDWALDTIGARGTRLTVTDLEGDGWPDLVIRRSGGRANDYVEGNQYIWVLKNDAGNGFVDVTVASGFLAMRTDPSGNLGRPGDIVAFGDVDNDGDLDGYHGLNTTDPDFHLGETSELLLNNGDGTFLLASETNGLRRRLSTDTPSGASFTDFDRDGKLDLWVTQNEGQDILYRGASAHEFVDATSSAKLTTEPWSSIADLNAGLSHTTGWGAAACDLNGDGFPELLSPSYGRAPNHLWQAEGEPFDVEYVNRSVASGYAYDDDLTWQGDHNALCYCQDNPAAEGCAGLPAPTIYCYHPTTGDKLYTWHHDSGREPYRLGGNSATAFCADVDNDGDLDLLTGEIKHWWAGAGADGSELLINDTVGADVTFSRPGDDALGLAIDHTSGSWDEGHMSSVVFDFDNDGWLDIYQGASDYASNHGLLYHQESALSFVEVPRSQGIDHNRSHGVVFADFDRDGDLDLVVGHSRSRCDAEEPDNCYETDQIRLFENVFGKRNNWIQLSLTGTSANRAAIGARVQVTAGGVTQTQEVNGGFGHFGAQNDLVLHFGIGDASSAEVSIRWPNVTLYTETFTAVARQRYAVEQGLAHEAQGCPLP